MSCGEASIALKERGDRAFRRDTDTVLRPALPKFNVSEPSDRCAAG